MKLLFNLVALLSLTISQVFTPQPAARPLLQEELTATPTETATATPTLAETATATETETALPAETPTVEPSATASETPTSTATETTTETATETGTPPSETSTLTPTLTSTATATPPPAMLALRATPEFNTPGGQAVIHWEVAGVVPVEATDRLVFTFPNGIQPASDREGTYDAASHTYTVTVKSLKGQSNITTQNVETVLIQAALLRGEQQLAEASVEFSTREEFIIQASGGQASAQAGRIKIDFPAGTFAEETVVDVGAPAGESVPEYSLSGRPFEIRAHGRASGQEITQFPTQVTITLSYADQNVPAEHEQDLNLSWYNLQTNDWEALLTYVDTQAKTLRAATTHFTVFDTGANKWQAGDVPSVEAFQVANFTGAGNFSLPINVPPSPGGLQPDLALSYNSQVVDQATVNSQASWVGIGWSLETGSIERDSAGTSQTYDDTYFLNVAGVSTRLVKDGSTWHAVNENFWKFAFDEQADKWTIWDKAGNIYYFEETTQLAYALTCDNQFPDDAHGGVGYMTYRWSLTRVRNPFAQELTYAYTTETKTIPGEEYIDLEQRGCAARTYTTETAVYPSTITYPNGQYRVRFILENRQDYPAGWVGDAVHHNFERKRLNRILVEQANGSDWLVIRKYELTYADQESGASIFPDYLYQTNGGPASTMVKVQEFGVGGTSALPAHTFLYDGLHLSQAANGYGGKAVFYYDTTPWSYGQTLADYTKIVDQCLDNPWTARSGSLIYQCDDTHSEVDVRGVAIAEKTLTSLSKVPMIRPGGRYSITFNIKSLPPNMSVQVGAFDGIADVLGPAEAYTTTGMHTYTFTLPSEANTFQPLIKTTGGASGTRAGINNFTVRMLPTFYRVTRKDLVFGPGVSDFLKYTYSYTTPAVNVLSNSPDLCPATEEGCKSVVEPYSEFRGHASVTETAPDGQVTTTNYSQQEDLAGHASDTSLWGAAGGHLLRQTLYTTDSTILNMVGAPPGFTRWGFKRYWVRPTLTEQVVYEQDGDDETRTRTRYTYEDTYGNLTQQDERTLASGSWTTYKTTSFDYNTPLVTGGKYIVGLLARQQVLSPSGILLGETINLYDGNTGYSAPLTTGKLTGQRTLLSCVNEDCTTAANLRYSDVSYGYDTWGNRVRTTAYDLAGTSSTPFRGNAVDTYTCYGTQATLGGRSCTNDGYHTYPLWTRNALGQDTNWTYDYARGVPLTETDPNGAVTTAQYDNFGRITSITRPGDEGAATLTMSYTASYPFTTTITQRIDAAQSYQVVRQYDGMGRQTQINSGGAITDTIYTSAKITQQRVPYLAGDPAPSLFYKTTADPDAQTVRVDAPDGTYTITTTDGFTTQVKDQRNNQTETAVDEWGRVVSVIPPTGPRVTYTYDRFNRLLTAARGGVTTTLTYDKAGRKTSMADPDMGYWSYGYNPLGNLTRQTDARGQRICLYYDPLSRLTGKHYRADDNCPENRPDPADVMYGYDQGTNGTGHRTNMTDASGSTAWTYDARGRVLTETKTITGGGPFVTQWEYNSADLPVTMTYPDLEQVTYEYNSRMLLNTVTGTSPYVMADTNGNGSYYDAAGRLTSRLLGNGLTQAFTYYGWAEQATVNGAQTGQGGRLKNLTVGSLQNLTYKYDEAGNVKEIANSVAPETQGYDYDALNRLTGWTLDGVQKTYSYNTAGNLSAKEGVALTYGDSSHPHAATASGSNSYSYDANGNMTLRGPAGQQFALAYDAEGRLVTVSGPSGFSAAFTYDGDGQRVKQVIGGTTTYFVGNYCEKTGSTITKYYYAGATRIGMRKYTIPQSMVVEYFLGDHLGSTSITTDNAGAKVSEMRYKPFGEVRYTWKDATLTQTTPAYALTRWTFTGQYSDSYINLLWYGSRHYDPELGRFISPDSIVPVAVQGVQAWDRYAYANNSPLNYVDPTGHFGQCHDGQSGYACRITQNKVAALRNQWAAEVAARAALLQATRANASLNDLLNCRDRVCESGVVGPSKIEPGNPFVCSSSICNPRSRAAPQTRDERTSVSQMPDDSSLLVALAAGLLTIKLGILDTVLAYAIISVAITSVTVPGAQIGLIGELVLIPLEAASLNLTIVAAEMALSGDTNVDMLPLVHVLFPDFMPYQP